MEALIGHSLKGYEIRELVGRGGFGSVYRAYQANIEREVAIKAILPLYANQPEFIRQFEAEARVIARLEHPFIVPLYDYWREPDAAYLVMRYFSAGSLSQFLKTQEQGLSLKRAAQILEQVASALDIAHQHNIIHLDIKPDNILMDAQGNAFLGDFGVARSLSEQRPKAEDGHATGSIAYMSPEMLRGEALSAQSDIYSLALVFYEILVGRHPFVDADNQPLSVNDLIMAQLMDNLPPINSLPAGVNLVLQRASAKDPLDRYPNARIFAQAIREVLAEESLLNASEIEELEQAVAISNPYKGLEAFGESDAQNFFGRETLIKDLLERMAAHPFLAVVGPSGSGKSSVIHAGLLPRLRQGALPGSESWFILSMKPDRQPMQQLGSGLRSIAIRNTEELEQLLQREGLEACLDTLLPNRASLLLVIDQFEEVFTQSDHKERRRFLDLLHTATMKAESRVHVLLTLRADFYDRPLLYETFGKLLEGHTKLILPLSSEELRAAIVRPAERLGLQLEPALVTAILADVSTEVGALPLLQYALTEVFQRRDGRKLTLAAYEASGGVLGALARRADEVYLGLSADSQAIAQQSFLRLVTLGEGTEDTRRRIRLAELQSLVTNKADLQAVMDTYGKYRLLSFDRDMESREATLEIAHEALIREWGRLKSWLGENRNDIRLQRLLANAAADWQSSHCDASYLLSGSRLAQYQDWLKSSNLSLSEEEYTFLQASVDETNRRESVAASQKAREERLQQRSQQFLRAIVVILFVSSIAGGILSMFSYWQSQIAQAERDSAESLSLALYAQNAYDEGDTVLALALALNAVALPNPPEDSYNTLLNLAYAPNLRSVFQATEQPISAMALSPAGDWLLLGAGNSPVPHLEAAGNGNLEGREPRLPSWIEAMRDESAFANNPVLMLNLATGQEIRRFLGHHASITDVIILEDGQAASASSDGLVFVWDLETGEAIYQFSLSPSRNISLSAAGKNLLVSLNAEASHDGMHILYDLNNGTEMRRIEAKTSALWSGLLFPDGMHGLSVHWDGVLIVWTTNPDTAEEDHRYQFDYDTQNYESYDVLVSADSASVALSGLDESLLIWDWQYDDVFAIPSPAERPHRLAIDATNERFVSISQFGMIDVWDLATDYFVKQVHSYNVASSIWANQLSLDASGHIAVLGYEDGRLEVWDLYSSPANHISDFSAYSIFYNAAYLSDTQVLLAASYEDEENSVSGLAIWDTTSNETLAEFSLPDISSGSLTISTDKHFAAVASETELYLFDLESQEEVWSEEISLPISDLAFNPVNAQQLLALDAERISLWDLAAHAVLQTYEGHESELRQLAFSPDGNRFLSSTTDEKILLWDTSSGEILRQFDTDITSDLLIFHPYGRMALRASQGNNLILWDLETGETVQTFSGHNSLLRDAVFSSDTRRLWTASADGELIAWNLETGEALHHYKLSEGQVWDIDMSPNGETLLSVSTESLYIWRTSPLDLAEVLIWIEDNRYIRSLTERECLEYRADCSN